MDASPPPPKQLAASGTSTASLETGAADKDEQDAR